MTYGPPLPLREYQRAAVTAAEERNIIVVLPTNAGKTIIAANVIEKTLAAENAPGGAARKVVFLAPTRGLAVQQARVLLQQIDALHMEGEENGKAGSLWRLGLMLGGYDTGMRLRLKDVQVAVMTPTIFEIDLNKGFVRMEQLALIVIDEAHQAKRDKRDQYSVRAPTPSTALTARTYLRLTVVRERPHTRGR